MVTAKAKDTRTIIQVHFPARRNHNPVGHLSAMLCKACVVAVRGEVLGIDTPGPWGSVQVSSRSQTGGPGPASQDPGTSSTPIC